MWLFSTVNSMSSQTQPQKVQVALLTTLSSAADMYAVLFTGSTQRKTAAPAESSPQNTYADCHTSSTSKLPACDRGFRPSAGWEEDPRATAVVALGL